VEALFAAPSGPLAGKRVLVTAGPTYEDIDPVRYVGNRSSGRMGYAIAAEAARRGAIVTVVAGPTPGDPPAAADVIRVRSAVEMHRAVMARADAQDLIVMAAAVADYAPSTRADQKIRKTGDTLTLTLVPNPDILKELGARRLAAAQGPLLVGFAAETEDIVKSAETKLRQKRVDLIVANDVSRPDAGFDVDTNEVTLVTAGGATRVPLQSKAGIAGAVLDRVEALLGAAAQAQAGSTP
jgi:phosphopantothenoylcysteine decarboxylase/phosphopantothenate--cysteine ligase